MNTIFLNTSLLLNVVSIVGFLSGLSEKYKKLAFDVPKSAGKIRSVQIADGIGN